MLLRAGDAHTRSRSASIHDRNPVFVRLSDGAIRNAYTVRIINKRARARASSRSASPGSPARCSNRRLQTRGDGRFVVEVGPDQTREVRVLVTDYADLPPPSTPIIFHLYDVDRPASGRRRATTSARPQEDEMIAMPQSNARGR